MAQWLVRPVKDENRRERESVILSLIENEGPARPGTLIEKLETKGISRASFYRYLYDENGLASGTRNLVEKQDGLIRLTDVGIQTTPFLEAGVRLDGKVHRKEQIIVAPAGSLAFTQVPDSQTRDDYDKWLRKAPKGTKFVGIVDF